MIDLERCPVYVACDDDTDDVLEYFWIKGLEPVPDAVQITKGSMIWLDREEPGLDGKELRVTIYDSEAASTSQSWIVEVP